MVMLAWTQQRWKRNAPVALRSGVLPALALACAALLLGTSRGDAQPTAAGVAFLAASQAADGSWHSPQVRPELATTEALRALQVLGAAQPNRSRAVAFLQSDPIADTDDRARRIAALAADASDVTALVGQLSADAD